MKYFNSNWRSYRGADRNTAKTGKTLLLEGRGRAAVEHGLKVAWFTPGTLGVLVGRHRAE